MPPKKIPSKRTASKRGRYYGRSHVKPEPTVLLPTDLVARFEQLLLSPVIKEIKGTLKFLPPPTDLKHQEEWIAEHENDFANRENKLREALEKLATKGRVNLTAVYEALARAKHASFKAILESQESKFMQDLVEQRTHIRKELTKWAKKAIAMHEQVFLQAGIDPRSWTQPYKDLLHAVNLDYLLKAINRNRLFTPSSIWQDGKHRRPHAGAPSKGWLKTAERELAQVGVSKALCEELLKATGLRAAQRNPSRTADL